MGEGNKYYEVFREYFSYIGEFCVICFNVLIVVLIVIFGLL